MRRAQALGCTLLLVALEASAQTAQEARSIIRSAVRDAQGKSFADFKADVGDVKLEVLKAGLRPDMTAETLAAATKKLSDFYQRLPVVETVQIPARGDLGMISFDCVPRDRQPSMQAFAADARDPLESPPDDPEVGFRWWPFGQLVTVPPAFPRPVTAFPSVSKGEAGTAACPPGTVPFQRHSVSEILSAPGVKRGDALSEEQRTWGNRTPGIDRNALRSLLGQQPGNVPMAPVHVHRYAHAAAKVPNSGAAARLNVWSPRVLDRDMSLSQIWVVAGDPNSLSLQTVEAGWQVMDLWGSSYAALFVYATADSYVQTGCYATKCDFFGRPDAFHFANNKIIVGLPIAEQSELNGKQATIELKWRRNPKTGSWWLKVNDDWVGYYPRSFFRDGPLTNLAEFVDFGGEATGTRPTSQMGSGRMPSAGRGYAAFQSQLRYYDVEGRPQPAPVVASMTDPACYSIVLNGPGEPHPQPGTYIFFGGPGTGHFPLEPGAAAPVACQ
jgi:hypothetical protein